MPVWSLEEYPSVQCRDRNPRGKLIVLMSRKRQWRVELLFIADVSDSLRPRINPDRVTISIYRNVSVRGLQARRVVPCPPQGLVRTEPLPVR